MVTWALHAPVNNLHRRRTSPPAYRGHPLFRTQYGPISHPHSTRCYVPNRFAPQQTIHTRRSHSFAYLRIPAMQLCAVFACVLTVPPRMEFFAVGAES